MVHGRICAWSTVKIRFNTLAQILLLWFLYITSTNWALTRLQDPMVSPKLQICWRLQVRRNWKKTTDETFYIFTTQLLQKYKESV